MNRTILSPIAVDLGAVNTGVVSLPELTSSVESLNAATIVINPGDITFGQKKRTARRHQVRVYKRRKMAKRLLWVILKSYYKVNVDSLGIKEKIAFEDCINGLLNRRGFSYYTEEINIEDLPDTQGLTNLGFHFINPKKTLESQLNDLVLNVEEHLKAPIFEWKDDSDEYKQALSLIEEESEKKCKVKFNKIRSTLKDILLNLRKNATGHKPRSEYFTDIRSDILSAWDVTLSPLKQTTLTPDTFANLVGHISNLQLRCLRKYFNVAEWKSGDQWDEARMASIFKKYLAGWHPDTDEKIANRNELRAWCAEHENAILDCWLEKSPVLSIPPYEDQNNRHPPKCSTLLLDGEVLDCEYPDWMSWIEAMNTQGFLDGAPYTTDKSQTEKDVALRKLQLIFDRSAAADCISLRKIVFAKDEASILEDLSILRARLGIYTETFIECATRYFKECKAAEKGEWYPEYPGRLLRLCNQNPPHKNKISHTQLSLLLGQDITEETLPDLIGYLSTQTKKEVPSTKGKKAFETVRFTPMIIGENATMLKKKFGQAFKELYNESLTEEKPDKEISSLRQKIPLVAEVLAEYFIDKDDDKFPKFVHRYNDPFIWSQIYDILKGDAHGFSHTCRHCTNDNHFRSSKIVTKNGEDIAHAKRLTANTNEPFDGMIAKLVKRIAIELAHLKANELTTWYQANQKQDFDMPLRMEIPFAVEENAFEFSMDTAEIKREEKYKNKDIKKLKSLAQRHDKQVEWKWQNKTERIKGDGDDICPYCGKLIGKNGQIDHIIPRAVSLKEYGTIFNSEPNLIYACTGCNKAKSNTIYHLKNLNSTYLKNIFDTDNSKVIASEIESKLKEIKKKNKHYATAFAEIPKEERQIIRHALFLDDASEVKKELLAELRQINKTNVNGTQRWLVKYFSKYLREILKKNGIPLEVQVKSSRFNADEISQLRKHLAEANPIFEKPEVQPAYSHIVDATLAFGLWNYTHNLKNDEDITETDRDAMIQAYLPTEFEIKNVSRKSAFDKSPAALKLFKDSIYGDRFFSLLLLKSGKLAFGFSLHEGAYCEFPKNKKTNPNEIYRLLRPFFQQKEKPSPETLEDWIEQVKVGETTRTIYPIHANHAREFLHYIAKNEATPEELQQAEMLDRLHYYTLKTSVFSVIDSIKKGKDKQAEITKFLQKNFAFTSEFNTKIVHPSYAVWEEILKDDMLYEISSEAELAELLSAKYAPRPSTTRKHTRAHLTFSLPILKGPSSGAFRVCRGTFDKKTWQVLECNTPDSPSTSGFEIVNGKTDFKREVERPELFTKNVYGVNGRHKASQRYTRMDKRQTLPIPREELRNSALLEAQLSPGSKDRSKVWLKVKTKFLNSLNPKDTLPLYAKLSQSIKLEGKLLEAWKTDVVLSKFKFRDNKCIVLASGKTFTILHGSIESPAWARNLYNKQE